MVLVAIRRAGAALARPDNPAGDLAQAHADPGQAAGGRARNDCSPGSLCPGAIAHARAQA